MAICCCQEEQELTTLPEHLSSLPVFSGVHVTQSLVLCVFCRSLFILFRLDIVLSALLRFMDSDYSFGIFKLLFSDKKNKNKNVYFIIELHVYLIIKDTIFCCWSPWMVSKLILINTSHLLLLQNNINTSKLFNCVKKWQYNFRI